jgi:hypothetical protein
MGKIALVEAYQHAHAPGNQPASVSPPLGRKNPSRPRQTELALGPVPFNSL